MNNLYCFQLVFIFFTIVSFELIAQKTNELRFEEANTVIDLEERSRRKFDNAVIVDLDQNGFLDLLLTEHARRVEVFWNENGSFTQGKPFIFGDTHGIAAGDYNNDGLIEVLVQPGGGNGKNPRKLRSYTIGKNKEIVNKTEFKHFLPSRGRAVKILDTKSNGDLDLILSAFPPRNKIEEGHFLYTDNSVEDFAFHSFLPSNDRFSMRVTLTDFNSDGIQDILFYGGQKNIAVKGTEDGNFIDVTREVLGKFEKLNLINSVSEIDYDNDGDFDLFVTRSKKPFDSEIEYDTKTETYYFFDRSKAFSHDLTIEGDFVLENLQMAFPHFDVFFGENKTPYERKLDRHGQHDFRLTSQEAKGFPKNITQKGLYIGYIGKNIWRVAGHTNSPTSAVIHNVTYAPAPIKLKSLPPKLLENQGGTFVDVSTKMGIEIDEQTSSSAVGDFNNDGWSDIFVVRYRHSASVIEQFILLNQQGKSFSLAKNHGIVRKELGATGMGADAVDYDNDGDLDIIYANERGRWHLFTNQTETTNNFVTINVGNAPSGKVSAISAILIFEVNEKTYKRVVGSTSSSYSQSFNTHLHIGLGNETHVSNAKIQWSNGEVYTFDILKINTSYNVPFK